MRDNRATNSGSVKFLPSLPEANDARDFRRIRDTAIDRLRVSAGSRPGQHGSFRGVVRTS